VTDGGGVQPPTQPTGGPPPGGGTTPPGNQPVTTSSTTTQLVSFYNNYTTPTTPWTAPPFVPQPIPGVTPGPCDTTGPHATSLAGSFLSIPAYSVGTHANSGAGGGVVNEPGSGALPILNVGPVSMLPPQLGVTPYQSLELLEPIDPNVSPKLRLAAAAGEPFACLQVETFGAQGSGYGYLVYALKGALVISVQDANADGSPFVQTLPSVASVPTPAVSPSSAKPGAKKPSTPSASPTPTAPKAKFERVKIGYTSVQWEYQDSGGANAPAHRGTGTITPPPPQSQLSYSNLVFAFGGLVAATVALMFAYHSRRRDLDRRVRGRRAARHV
jgi:type VI protein secretion system component Hcp